MGWCLVDWPQLAKSLCPQSFHDWWIQWSWWRPWFIHPLNLWGWYQSLPFPLGCDIVFDVLSWKFLGYSLVFFSYCNSSFSTRLKKGILTGQNSGIHYKVFPFCPRSLLHDFILVLNILAGSVYMTVSLTRAKIFPDQLERFISFYLCSSQT